MQAAHSNERYLPGVPFPDALAPTADLPGALAEARDVLVVVPSSAFRATLGCLAQPLAPDSRLPRVAARILARDEDRVVLGPAEDGGYYLLGMKQAHAGLFADIDWSTDRVAAQTRARAAALGLPVIELLPWYDVDEPATLRRLLRELGQPGRFAAPHTASCVARLGLSADEAEHSAIPTYAERDVGATLAGAVECP